VPGSGCSSRHRIRSPILDLAQGQALLESAPSVVGYIPAGTYIDALLVAEPGPDLRIVGRIEFYLPGILNRDACTALAFLTLHSAFQ
jgi:hypothetical protein